jgi:hypothetical protein
VWRAVLALASVRQAGGRINLVELELLEREIKRRADAREARLARKREKARRRREAIRQAKKVEIWLERGYGAR